MTPVKSMITKWLMGMPKVFSMVWMSGSWPLLKAALILLSVANPVPEGMPDNVT